LSYLFPFESASENPKFWLSHGIEEIELASAQRKRQVQRHGRWAAGIGLEWLGVAGVTGFGF
jgi:hypothetical protein